MAGLGPSLPLSSPRAHLLQESCRNQAPKQQQAESSVHWTYKRFIENSPFLGSGSTGSNGPASRAQRARPAQRAQRARRAREAVAPNEPIIPSGAGVTLYI
jgi:hypothetical protein